jgi:hypothetical protein
MIGLARVEGVQHPAGWAWALPKQARKSMSQFSRIIELQAIINHFPAAYRLRMART